MVMGVMMKNVHDTELVRSCFIKLKKLCTISFIYINIVYVAFLMP